MVSFLVAHGGATARLGRCTAATKEKGAASAGLRQAHLGVKRAHDVGLLLGDTLVSQVL